MMARIGRDGQDIEITLSIDVGRSFNDRWKNHSFLDGGHRRDPLVSPRILFPPELDVGE